MKTVKKEFSHLVLKGSSYEVGRKQAELIKNIPGWVRFITSGKTKFKNSEFAAAQAFFEDACPGLNDELRGMADALGVPVKHMSFYYHSYLRPHCSSFSVLPEKSADGHVYACRSYEFNFKMDDFRLCSTKIAGKYGHTGFSSMIFGRNEGINEKGLCVTMSSAGFPVGAMKWFRSPAVTGAHFWLLVRGILENCKDTAEAVGFVKKTSIAFNVNLLLTDKSGASCLVETFDGRKALKMSRGAQFLGAANHAVLPEIKKYAGRPMLNSVKRYELIENLFAREKKLSLADLKGILSAKYPAGLAALYYRKFFGTLYSVIFDVTGMKMHVRFGPPPDNPWKTIDARRPRAGAYPCVFREEAPPKDFFKLIED